MCWFVLDPDTGNYGEHVATPSQTHPDTLYLHNIAFDSFFDIRTAFQQFMAPHPRPPFEDLVAFAVDGWIPESMHFLMGPELGHHHQAMQNFWKSWDEGEDGYLALLGRPMRREEKYWLIQHWLRRVAIGRDQFYVGKQLAKEEWLVSPESYFDRKWCDGCWGRLRVFSDGSADAWIPGTGLLGYENEEYAR